MHPLTARAADSTGIAWVDAARAWLARFPLSILLLAGLLVVPAVVRAHAFLDHANPRVGSAVRTAPREVTLWFTQDLEPAFSTVEVTNASGAVVAHSQNGKITVALSRVTPNLRRRAYAADMATWTR